MYAQVDGCALAGLDDFFLYLFPHLRHHLFDACRVYAAVGHQLVQCQACYLAAHGVKAGKYDGLWGVVHYYLDSGSGFQGAYVAAFPTDYAAFDFIGVDVEYCHGVLYGGFGGHTLD